MLREKLIELNGNGRDVDAIIQVGTNLSMVRLAAAAEMWLGKARHRHQHRDLLARAAAKQNHGQDPGLGVCSRNFETGQTAVDGATMAP